MVRYRLGVDIGGTFTDFALIDDLSGKVSVNKALTTPHDPSEVIMKGTRALLDRQAISPSDVDIIVQGTTLATNALIERKGAKTGLITTFGFRDVLEMGRGDRKELYNYLWKKPKPLVPRHLRLGLDERTDALGRILRKVRREDVARILEYFKEKGVEAVAVCLLHSYANPENEIIAGGIIRSFGRRWTSRSATWLPGNSENMSA